MGARAALIAATGVGFVAYLWLVVIDADSGTLRADSTPTSVALIALAFAAFIAVVWLNERRSLSAWWLWTPPVLYRVMLWFTTPSLSDDVYRYLWDGHVFTNGINPYSFAINAADLDTIDIAARALTNNPGMSSPYLPAAQALFGLMALLGLNTPASVQIVMTVFDLATAVFLYRLLPRAGLAPSRVVLYLWNPLVIVELAHGAHLDGFMVVLVVASVLASTGDQRGPKTLVSPIALGLATLTRPVPLLLAPIMWWRWSWGQRLVYLVTVVGPIAAFSTGRGGLGLSGELDGIGVFGPARIYSQDFRFNAPISTWLESTLGNTLSLSTVLAIVMAGVLAIVFAKARTVADSSAVDVRQTARLLSLPLMAYVLITPVMHPWYLVLLLAFVPFLSPGKDEATWRWLLLAPWLYLAASLPLSYLTYVDPDDFAELDWVLLAEWLPTVALLGLAIGQWYIRGRGQDPARPSTVSGQQ